MNASWIRLNDDARAELSQYSRTVGWTRLTAEKLPLAVPLSLRAKIDSAVAITTPTSTGGTYVVFSMWRRDTKDSAFDNEPFGLIVHSSGASEAALFLHHGDWEGRTERVPEHVWDEIEHAEIGNLLWAKPPLDQSNGQLSDLVGTPHDGAFQAMIRRLRIDADARRCVS